MGDKTGIQWCDATWNPIRGCSRVSEGCRHCYAERTAGRFSGPGQPYEGLATRKLKVISDDEQRTEPRWTGEVRFIAEHLADPLRWKKPRRIFVNSMSDLFHEKLSNEQIAAIFGVMAACPQHTFQVLTKRAKRMREWFEWAASHGDGHDLMRFGPSGLLTCAWEACSGDAWGDIEPHGVLESLPSADVFGTAWPLPNVWLGVSIENRDALSRLAELRACPAAVHFVSAEPLLEDLGAVDLTGIDWLIAGCESGAGARPCNVDWLRSLRNQCHAAGVPYFLKQAKPQLGASTLITTKEQAESRVQGKLMGTIPIIGEGPGSTLKQGNVIGLPYLDGVQHKEFPNANR